MLQLAGTGGRIFIMMEHKHDYTEADIIRQNPALLPGGVGRPRDCTARHRVAVIVPYRDRQQHLNILLSHLHPMLQRQQLDYRIYVVEQVCTGGIIWTFPLEICPWHNPPDSTPGKFPLPFLHGVGYFPLSSSPDLSSFFAQRVINPFRDEKIFNPCPKKWILV